MSKKTILITGSTSGIGLYGALTLARQEHRILVHARNDARGNGPLSWLREQAPRGNFELVTGDLSSIKSILGLADQVFQKTDKLDVLWNNAGGLQKKFTLSPDGNELTMAINHLAPFLLTKALLPLLKNSPASLVLATSSMAHHFGPRIEQNWFALSQKNYGSMGVYGRSKLANILFTLELRKQVEGSSIKTASFHPGWVKTGFGSSGDPSKKDSIYKFLEFSMIEPEMGADTGVYLALNYETLDLKTSTYFVRRRAKNPGNRVNTFAAKNLWDESEKLTSI